MARAWLRALTVYNKTHHHEAVYTTSDTTGHVACLFSGITLAAVAHYLQHTQASSQSSEAAGKGGPSASLSDDDES